MPVQGIVSFYCPSDLTEMLERTKITFLAFLKYTAGFSSLKTRTNLRRETAGSLTENKDRV